MLLILVRTLVSGIRSVVQRRALQVLAALLVALLLQPMVNPTLTSQAQGGRAQLWGQRFSSSGYWGADVYQTLPNPDIPAGSWIGGPVGVTNLVGKFIESGPTKACDIDCGLHPYGSWGNKGAGTGDEQVKTNLWLAAEGSYQYQSDYLGNNNWGSTFCSGSGCGQMVSGNLGTDKLPYVAAGGESSGVRWGTIRTNNAKYKSYNSATKSNWCYTSTTNNCQGEISPCNASTYSWTSTY